MCPPEQAPKGVDWQDLTGMRRGETLRELGLPLPWLGLSLWLYSGAFWWLGALAVILLAIALNSQALWLHLAAMACAQCLTAFFAVWITHQGTTQSGLAGRSQRGPLARLSYLMFYHREHHLFPKVPVRRLPVLAQRLDARVPGYAQARVPVVRFMDGNQ